MHGRYIMSYNLEGKVAVISGGDSGIGLAISNRLKNNGVKIYNISKKAKKLPIFQDSFACDISDENKLKEVVSSILNIEKNIDLLFCNAGIGIGGLVENASLESIDKLFNVNLIAQIKMTNLFLKYINPNGRIVYTGSLAAIIPLPYQACYGASKAAIENFSRALSTEVRDRKIKVTTFLPCDVKTGFTDARIVEIGKDLKEAKGIENMEKSERNGASPDYIAKRVLKFVKKNNPPLRKSMGVVAFPLTGKTISFLIRILPIRFINFLVRKIYL